MQYVSNGTKVNRGILFNENNEGDRYDCSFNFMQSYFAVYCRTSLGTTKSCLCNLDEYVTTPPLCVPRNGEWGGKTPRVRPRCNVKRTS